MKDKKKKIIIGCSILIVILILLGISYAFLRNRIYGEKGKIVYHTSGLDVVLEEDSTPSLELTGAVPMSDTDGLKSDKIYRFTVVNRSISNLKYKVYLDNDNEALKECGDTCEYIPDRDIKYEIKKDQSSINTLENRELADGRLVKGGRETYELKLWINSEAGNEIVGKYFFGKIRVEVVQDYNNPKEPKLASNMIPVRYDGSNWVKASKNNWYDYEKQEWANAVTVQGINKTIKDVNNNTIIDNEKHTYYTLQEDGSAHFNGNGEFLNLGHANENFENNQISMVIRLKFHKKNVTYSVFGNWEGAGGGFVYNSNNTITFRYWIGDNYHDVVSTKTYDIDTWYTLVGTYNGTELNLYINGEKFTSNVSGTIKVSPAPFIIGGNPYINGVPSESVNSSMTVSDALIYKDVLMEDEVRNYFSGTVNQYPNDNLLIGNISFKDLNFYNPQDFYQITKEKEAYLDGVDDFINLGHINENFENNQISMVIRLKFHKKNATDYIFGNWEGAGGGFIHNSNNTITFEYWIGNNYHEVVSTNTYDIDTWYTLVGTYDGTKLKLYINGEEFTADINGTLSTSPAPFVLGGNPYLSGFPNNFTNMTVSDAFIYKDALTADEVQSYFNGQIKNYPKDNMIIGINKFGENNVEEYKKASDGTIVPMDLINTMWVWIPRYSYTIGSEDGTNYYGKQGEFLTETPTLSLPGEIDVKFVDKNTKDRGSAKYKVSEGVSGWYTPDAFTFGGEELEGIWVGKFETSNKEGIYESDSDSDSLTPIIKPKVTSWRNIRVSTLETVSMNMNKTNNIYGFLESEVDTHAIKGSEWALAAYLSQSKYGKLGNRSYSGVNKEVYVNAYTEFRTGCSCGNPTGPSETSCSFEYDNIEDRGEGLGSGGGGASTTGNIYGIYDMSGGSYEYVMSNTQGYSGYTKEENSGYTGLLTSGDSFTGIPFPNEKYYDKYLTTNANILSHALGETFGWYGDSGRNEVISSNLPWQMRGGVHYNSASEAGIFNVRTAGEAGGSASAISYRIVLVNK